MTKEKFLRGLSDTGLKKFYEVLKRHSKVLAEDEIETLLGTEAELFEKSWSFNENEVQAELDRRNLVY